MEEGREGGREREGERGRNSGTGGGGMDEGMDEEIMGGLVMDGKQVVFKRYFILPNTFRVVLQSMIQFLNLLRDD